jgi:hypothetical protein
MKARIWSATCGAVALGATVAVLAQNPPTSQAPQQSASAKTITVTGCVQKAQQAPGTSGATSAAPGAATEIKFVLTNAAISTTGTTGTAGTAGPPSTAVASEYRLDTEEAKLTPHVGHKVEISGTVAQPTGAAPQPPTASAANAPTLKVDNVKMVAATCP